MSIEIQTGVEVEVTDASDAEFYSAMQGDGNYILKSPLELTMANTNTLVIGKGTGLQNGRHIRFKGVTELTIPSGLQAQKVSNIAVVRTTITRDEETMETITHSEGLVLTGEPTMDGEPTDPEWIEGNLLEGDTIADFPIARVVTDGINVRQPEPLFEVLVSEKDFRDSQSQLDVYESGDCLLTINEANRIAIAYISDTNITTSGYHDYVFNLNAYDYLPPKGEKFVSFANASGHEGWIGVRSNNRPSNDGKLLVSCYTNIPMNVNTQIVWMF